MGQDAQLSAAAELAAQGVDPSNTYEQGVRANVNRAVPEGARVVTTLDEAMDAGYIGYSPGIDATDELSVTAAGKRNQRLRELRKAAINGDKQTNNGDK